MMPPATSRHFLAASIQRVRFLPVPSAACVVDDQDASSLPVALAVWSEDAQRHALTLGDVVAVGPSSEMVRFDVRGMAPHRGAVADLRSARCGGAVVVAAAGCAGGVALLRLGLGALPAGADAADLEPPQMDLDADGFLRPAVELPGGAPVASADLHGPTGQLLAAGGDGALVVAPAAAATFGAGQKQQQQQQQQQAPAYREGVRGWGGFTQARWVDSHTFATVSVFVCSVLLLGAKGPHLSSPPRPPPPARARA
jgi:hypothetical protein